MFLQTLIKLWRLKAPCSKRRRVFQARLSQGARPRRNWLQPTRWSLFRGFPRLTWLPGLSANTRPVICPRRTDSGNRAAFTGITLFIQLQRKCLPAHKHFHQSLTKINFRNLYSFVLLLLFKKNILRLPATPRTNSQDCPLNTP